MLQDLQEISDGKIYSVNDMVRAACKDCEGCHACCEKMGDSIVLDPLDVYRLTEATGKDFQALLADTIELHVTDGMILPSLKMAGETERCVFLDEAGRCSIHALRPGLCRVFPLGRIYEERQIKYFLQKDACQKPGRSKVKVGKWLDMTEPKAYERFLLAWHGFRRSVQAQLTDAWNEQTAKTANMLILNLFYGTPYDKEGDFYVQFGERVNQAERALGIEAAD
ncbi:MAG: YkgJ family cysteine cluster protein [Roseburia sp.]|nr:YkgJ family cysteine cluster protein [Roseburia sp.]